MTYGGMIGKGLGIAEDFFRQWGLPAIQERWPSLVGNMAAGRIFGSDVLGGDDEVSRDHNWGPQFHIWLHSDDYVAMGLKIEEALNGAAPNPWNGFRVAGGGDKSVHVHNIETYCNEVFHGQYADFRNPPWEYLKDHESNLYFIRHGAIWHDPASLLGEVQSVLHFYPKQCYLQRLKEECFRVWHHGEYNFVQRMVKRADPIACAICLGEFISGVMKLCFLISKDYAPYWKWLAFEFRKREESCNIAVLLDSLARDADLHRQAKTVLMISKELHEMLLRNKIVRGANPNKWLTPLLNDHNEIADELSALQTSATQQGAQPDAFGRG